MVEYKQEMERCYSNEYAFSITFTLQGLSLLMSKPFMYNLL